VTTRRPPKERVPIVNLIRRSRRVNSKKEKDTLGRNDETRIGSSTVLVQTPHCMIEENLGKLPLRSKSTLSQSSTCSETKSEVTPNRMVLPEENSVSQGQFLPKVIIQEIVEESYCDSVVPRSNTFLVEAKLENDTLSHPNIIPLEIKGIPKKSAPFSSGRVEPGASKVNELSSLVNEQPSDDIKSLSHENPPENTEKNCPVISTDSNSNEMDIDHSKVSQSPARCKSNNHTSGKSAVQRRRKGDSGAPNTRVLRSRISPKTSDSSVVPEKRLSKKSFSKRNITPVITPRLRFVRNDNPKLPQNTKVRDVDFTPQKGNQEISHSSILLPLNAGKTRKGKKKAVVRSPPITKIKKQKLPVIPKRPVNVPHFYNKVVKWKDDPDLKYFFVIYFDTERKLLKLCPLYRQGIFTGKRIGRTRWKVKVDGNIFLEEAEKFKIVPTQVVAKTPFVAGETWDVLD